MRFDPPWDRSGSDSSPVLRRYSAASPETLAQLPEGLGAHPFAPIIEAHPDPVLAHGALVPVPLDPGTDLADWRRIKWHVETGSIRVITTGLRDEHTVPLQRLSDFAKEWATPRPIEPLPVIDVDPRLVRRVGRGGALVDAQLADPDVDVDDYLVVYDEGDPVSYVGAEAGRLGKRAFAWLTSLPVTVAERVARGQPISNHNLAQALKALLEGGTRRTCGLDDCDQILVRPNAKYCSKRHKDAAYRARRRIRAPEPNQAADPVCSSCGVSLLGAAIAGPCPVCSTVNGEGAQP